jgi:nitric oxide reductase NorE protein
LGVFTILFGRFLVNHASDLDAFERARNALNPTHGGINTLLLLTSSWLVIHALLHARVGATRRARRTLAFAIVLGAAFVGSKVGEYAMEIGEGHAPAASDFFMNYFLITGLHLFHVVVGCLLLTGYLVRWRNGVDSQRLTGFETVACYWHMVDFLWILIFPLLYLAR